MAWQKPDAVLTSPALDPAAVRRQFNRRGAALADADFLLREVEGQMLDRLDVIRVDPQRIVDIGCGLGAGLLALRRRFQQAEVIGIDAAETVVQCAAQVLGPPPGWLAGLTGRLRRQREPLVSLVVGDQHQLPLPDSSADLVWSSLCLHWSHDPQAVIAQWQRLIRPGGLLMFSVFGVDTLAELRRSGAELMPFNDMHDLGDALVGAGFADPVMDMQMMTIQFSQPERLLADLRALGGNALASRARHLQPAQRKQAWQDNLLHLRDKDSGQIPVTFEICFGHAWCPSPKRLPAGLAPVTFHPPGPGRA